MMRVYSIELKKSGRDLHQTTRHNLSGAVVSVGWSKGLLAMTETLKDVIIREQIKRK